MPKLVALPQVTESQFGAILASFRLYQAHLAQDDAIYTEEEELSIYYGTVKALDAGGVDALEQFLTDAVTPEPGLRR